MTENRWPLGTISEIIPAHKKSKCVKTLQELMPAQESHRTPCSVQTACKGAAAPVRRELYYSSRQKAGLVVLIIC